MSVGVPCLLLSDMLPGGMQDLSGESGRFPPNTVHAARLSVHV